MAELSNMPKDVIHAIMLLLVSSLDGAQDFARALSVSKLFYGFAKDQKLEKALVFENVSITEKFRTVLRSNDLLFRCAKVGNLSAQHLLSKVLVMSSSLLYERKWFRLPVIRHCPDPNKSENYDEEYDAFSEAGFVKRIIKDKEQAGCHHTKLVQSFLRCCTPSEIAELGEHLFNYVCYFSVRGTSRHLHFGHCVREMIRFGKDIDAGAQVKLLEIRKTISAKRRALGEQWESRKKTRGAVYSFFIAEELRKEIKMRSMFDLGLVCPDIVFYEKNPAIYFELSRRDALENFAMFFIELE